MYNDMRMDAEHAPAKVLSLWFINKLGVSFFFWVCYNTVNRQYTA